MLEHSRSKAAGIWRRWVFVIWIALTIIIAIYAAVAAPFATYFNEGMAMIAVIVPPLMILLLGIGIGWLLWLATSSSRRDDRAARR